MLKLYAKFVLWRNHYCLKHMEEKYYVMWESSGKRSGLCGNYQRPRYSCRACRDERWEREDVRSQRSRTAEKERVKRHNEVIAKAISKLQEKI